MKIEKRDYTYYIADGTGKIVDGIHKIHPDLYLYNGFFYVSFIDAMKAAQRKYGEFDET